MQPIATLENFTILEAILYVLSIAYITHILMLHNANGPFKSGQSTVLYQDDTTRPVNLFDYLRRLFRVYDIDGHVWQIKESVYLWYCPYCLSFWINDLVLLLLFILKIIDTYYLFLLLFSVPYIVGFLESKNE